MVLFEVEERGPGRGDRDRQEVQDGPGLARRLHEEVDMGDPAGTPIIDITI
jgi:hypothetical protein